MTTVAPAGNSCAFTAIRGLEKVMQCPSTSSCPNISSVTWCVTRIVPKHLDQVVDPFEVCVSRIGVVRSEENIPFDNGSLVVDDKGLLTLSAAAVAKFKSYDRINCSVINETTSNICDETSGINLTVTREFILLISDLIISHTPFFSLIIHMATICSTSTHHV